MRRCLRNLGVACAVFGVSVAFSVLVGAQEPEKPRGKPPKVKGPDFAEPGRPGPKPGKPEHPKPDHPKPDKGKPPEPKDRGKGPEPKPDHAKPAKPDEPSVTVRGKVGSFRKNGKGDVDGLILDGEREIRFPPHVGQDVVAVVQVGDEVEVAGRDHTGPQGEKHIHARSIRDVATGQQIALSGPPPKPEKKPHPEHKPKPEGKPKGEPSRPAPEADQAATIEQLVKEVRELRKQVEKQSGQKPGKKPSDE